MDLTITRAETLKTPPDDSDLSFGTAFTDHMYNLDYDPDNGWHAPRIEPYGAFSLDPSTMILHYGQGIFEGLKAYPNLHAIESDTSVDVVDLFVAPERTPPVVEQAAQIGAKTVWFQPGAEHEPAEDKARELGLEVFSGVCPKAEHSRLFGS